MDNEGFLFHQSDFRIKVHYTLITLKHKAPHTEGLLLEIKQYTVISLKLGVHEGQTYFNSLSYDNITYTYRRSHH